MEKHRIYIVDDNESRKKALAVNAVGFFRKPVDGSALLDAIDWVLKNTRIA